MHRAWNWFLARCTTWALPPTRNWFTASLRLPIPPTQSGYRFWFKQTSVVMSSVFRAFHYKQVYQTVICLIVIGMMNDLTWKKFSPNLFFHQVTVLWNVFSRNPDTHILTRKTLSAFPVCSLLTLASAGKRTVFSALKFVRPTVDISFAFEAFFNHA